jgi:uncharacterized repeat protein (TIGR01451 family)
VNKADNQDYSATYTVQSNANGPDTYTIATAYDSVNDVTGAAAPTSSTASITLGATAAAAIAATGQPVITVPADGVGGTEVNGLEADDLVVIGGAIYEILSVVDNATGTSTITLKSNLGGAMAIGDGIFEYVSFTVDITDVGAAGGSTNRLDLATTVTSDTDGGEVYSLDVDINIVAITIQKFVREITGACVTTICTTTAGTTNYDNGGGASTYYDAGVEAAPGDTLEYLLVITTSTASITTALIVDTLPDFTTYVTTTTTLNAIAVTDEGGGGFPLDSGADDGGLLVDDDAARTAGNEGTGAIGTSKIVYVTYQVDVDN